MDASDLNFRCQLAASCRSTRLQAVTGRTGYKTDQLYLLGETRGRLLQAIGMVNGVAAQT
jgi:hypothetical protein